MTEKKKPAADSANADSEKFDGFSAEERQAMKDRAKELKAAARKDAKAADIEKDALAKIAEMPQPDRGLAERIHALVKENAPQLNARLFYGMPAWANENGKNVCFFQPADKFKVRYATLGFDEAANLDDGNMWATAYAVTKLTAADEKRIAAMIRQAVS